MSTNETIECHGPRNQHMVNSGGMLMGLLWGSPDLQVLEAYLEMILVCNGIQNAFSKHYSMRVNHILLERNYLADMLAKKGVAKNQNYLHWFI
ncbi:hypothetical protein HS088_TW21G00518 [Tripterygium wilfordii]|uniref:Uncharacterized protein n=1 Tax=Tripterygium wilfordii TaxID=458696 RepID=A0A7J7C2P4_TRIWF|nr:hypothetical protein HS088_TW21G00518 [Tripterygium wilfordii]